MITPKEIVLLECFGSHAIPSFSYHPLDVERWGDFVFQVYKNTKRGKPIAIPTQNEMIGVLSKYGFNASHIQYLYDMMQDDLIVVSRCWWRK